MKDTTIVIRGNYQDRDIKKAMRDLKAMETQGPRTAKGFSSVSTSFKGLAIGIGAGAILGGAARGLIDMASAAAEDEKSVISLSKAMQNVNLGGFSGQAEDFVTSLQLATGTADTEIRKSMQFLISATGDLKTAQAGTNIVLDMAAQGYGDTESAAKALAKAYGGNTVSLGKLVPGMDKAILKTGDMRKITAELARITGGAAAAAAASYSGKLARMGQAAGEAGEAVGYELLANLDALGGLLGGTDGVVSMLAGMGDSAAASLRPIREITDVVDGFNSSLQSATGHSIDFGQVLGDSLLLPLGPLGKAWMAYGDNLQEADKRSQEFANHTTFVRDKLIGLAQDAGLIDRNLQPIPGAMDDTGDAAGDAAKKVVSLSDAFAALNGNLTKQDARAGMESALLAFQGLDTTKTVGSGKGAHDVKVDFMAALNAKGTNFDLTKQSGIDGQAAASASIRATQDAMAAYEGDPAMARKIRRRGIRQLSSQLQGIGFGQGQADAYARSNLQLPDQLKPSAETMRLQGQVGGNTFTFTGDIKVGSLVEAARVAENAKRLATLGRGRTTRHTATGGGN